MSGDMIDTERQGTVDAALRDSSEPSEAIFRQLSELWRADPACADLLQFRRLATAHQYRRLYRLVRRYLAPDATVLDWGCGNGHVSYGLSRMGYRVTGYAFDDFGLRRHLDDGYTFEQGNPEDPSGLPFPSGSFDAVMSVGVLEHVRETGGDEIASLLEIHRVLRPGGVFLCYHLPNRYSFIEAITRRIPSTHSHRFRYTMSDIEALCRRSGLELAEAKRYAALPRNLWHRFPPRIGDSTFVTAVWDAMDAVLETVLSPWCQNYLFAARRSGRTEPDDTVTEPSS
jgi:SAM-dependent methyltransferase